MLSGALELFPAALLSGAAPREYYLEKRREKTKNAIRKFTHYSGMNGIIDQLNRDNGEGSNLNTTPV